MINILDYGYVPTMVQDDINGMPARIMAVHKERYELICEYGEIHGRLKSSIYYGNGLEDFPSVGDFVLIHYNPSGDSLIIKTLERKSKFSRSDFSGHAVGYVKTVKEQVVAANFDYVFILASLNMNFNIKRIERYLALAWESGGIPVIILTKADLVEDYTEQIRAVEEIAMGVGIYAISSKTGAGLDKLYDYLKPKKTIVFLGSSGVGKSSLVNALAFREGHEEEVMFVNEIREKDSRGRHTTTHRQLILLNNGVMIIDTPGMREIGMWSLAKGLEQSFSDVEQYFGQCKFNDCKHQSEPGCAIKAAISNGELSLERWNRYLKLKNESKFSEDKSSYLQGKKQFHKSLAKNWKNKNKYKDR